MACLCIVTIKTSQETSPLALKPNNRNLFKRTENNTSRNSKWFIHGCFRTKQFLISRNSFLISLYKIVKAYIYILQLLIKVEKHAKIRKHFGGNLEMQCIERQKQPSEQR